MHRRGGGACVDQPLGVNVGLRIDGSERTQYLAKPPPHRAVTRRAAVRHARVDEEDRHAAPMRLAYEGGPYLGFHEYYCAGTYPVQGTTHAPPEVQRIVYERVAFREFAPSLLPACGGGRRKDKADVRVARTHRAHQLARHRHFANAHRMNPYRIRRQRKIVRVSPEPVAHARTIAAPALHAQQKRRHHRHIGDGKKQFIENPFHRCAFIIPYSHAHSVDETDRQPCLSAKSIYRFQSYRFNECLPRRRW